MSIGDENVPQPITSCNQNAVQPIRASFEALERVIQEYGFTWNLWPLLSDSLYSMVDKALLLAIEAQDHQWSVAAASVGTPSLCQLHSSLSLYIDLLIPVAVSFEFWYLLFYQTCNIDYAPHSMRHSEWKISTIWEQLVDMTRQTIVHSSWLNWIDSELHILVKELLFDFSFLSQVVEDNESRFARMDIHDLICYQLFFSANGLGHQPTTLQFFQLVAPQTLPLAATTRNCVLSEYSIWKMASDKCSQDEYWGKCYSTPVLNFTLEGTHHIIPALGGQFVLSDKYSSPRIGTPYITIHSPQPSTALFHFFLNSTSLGILLLVWALLNPCWYSYNAFYASYPTILVPVHLDRHCSHSIGTPLSGLEHL